jgi:uncharacterized Zn-finger protein
MEGSIFKAGGCGEERTGMAGQQQFRKIKCPYCGWIRTITIGVTEDESMATVARGLSEALKAIAEKIKAAIADTELDEANAWIDMPACPHCNNVYRYNVRTGEVRR